MNISEKINLIVNDVKAEHTSKRLTEFKARLQAALTGDEIIDFLTSYSAESLGQAFTLGCMNALRKHG